LNGGRRYETLAGKLFVTPAPSPRPQTVLGTLCLLIRGYVDRHGLGPVWFAPLDVVFGAAHPGGAGLSTMLVAFDRSKLERVMTVVATQQGGVAQGAV
jgi:hypothetical protein